MSTIRRLVATLLCASTVTAFLPAQDAKPPVAKPPANAPAKVAAFVVVKLGDKLEVMGKDDVEAKKKTMADEFEKATKQYEADKKAATDAHKKFEGAMPQKVAMEVTPGEFATRELAEAALNKMKMEKEKMEKKDKGEKKDKVDKKDTPPAKGEHKKSGGGK